MAEILPIRRKTLSNQSISKEMINQNWNILPKIMVRTHTNEYSRRQFFLRMSNS